MAQSKSKLSRKELKQPDQFQSRGEDFLQTLIDQKRKIAIAAGILLGILVTYSAVASYLESRDEAVSKKFGRVMSLYEGQVAAKPEEANPEGNPPTFASEEMKFLTLSEEFQTLVDEHRGTGFGKAARFYLGNCFFMLKRYEKAREAYQAFLDDASGGFKDLEFLALSNIAQTHDAEGNLDEAAAVYQRIVDGKNATWKGEASYSLAQIKKRQGKPDEAISLLLSIQSDTPDSTVKAKADKLLTVLRGPEVPVVEAAKPEEAGEGN